jgi:hypothetical protein
MSIITDRHSAYSAALRTLASRAPNDMVSGQTAELKVRTCRSNDERKTQDFRSAGSAQRFLSSDSPEYRSIA